MPFPTTPLPNRVRIWPGVNPSSSPLVWPDPVEITSKVRVEQGIDIDYGRPNEAADVDAASYAASVDNRTGDFTPDNPLGLWFGGLRRNTPIRDSTDVLTDDFNRVTAAGSLGTVSNPGVIGPLTYTLTSASDWSTNGAVAQVAMPTANVTRYALVSGGNAANPAGRIDLSCPVIATGTGIAAGVVAHYYDATNLHYFALIFDLAGVLKLRVSRWLEGSYLDVSTVTLAATYSAGQVFTLKWDSCGPTILLKAWATAGAEPAWQLRYDDADVPKGGRNGLFVWRFSGNTNAGSVTSTFDNFVLESTEFQGYISELPTRWDMSGKDSIVPLRASGVLRRLGQGATPLKSPLYRQLTGTNDANVKPSAYWPLEDDSSAVYGANALGQGAAMSVTDVQFGADTSLVSSLQTAKLSTAAARATGIVRGTRNGGTGFSAMLMFKLPAGVVGSNFISVAASGTPSSVTNWTVRVDAASVTLVGYDSSGNAIVTPAAASWIINPTGWTAIQIETEILAGSTTYSLIWHAVGDINYYSISGTYASASPSKATGITIASSATLVGTLIGHAWIGENTLPFVTNTFSLVSNGYIGELPGARFTRLLKEEGVIGSAESGTDQPMGAQGFDALLPLLRECAAADYGVMYESGYGVYLRPRAKRYNRSVMLGLALSTGGASAPLQPTFDDANLRNEWQVSRKNGSQGAIVSDLASIAAEGRYDDSATINVATDDVLVNHAGWRVFLGTRPLTRWPAIEFSIAARPALAAGWRQSLIYGQRITLATAGLTQLAGQTVDVIIEGWSVRKSAFEWTVTLNCTPYSPWAVALLDDAAGSRLDTSGSYLLTTINSTATSITVRTTDGPTWTTAAGDLPFDIIVEGEQMTVTAVGALAGADQVLTVTRSVNGIVRSHTGATTNAVTLYQPFYLPL